MHLIRRLKLTRRPNLIRGLRRDERGVTLIEMLMVIVILSIIAVPLGNALIGFFRNTDVTTRRLAESHDAQLAATYFAQDVESVGTRDYASAFPYPFAASVEVNATALATPASARDCGTAATPAAVLRLAWDDPDDTSASDPTSLVRVSYVVVPTSGERQLHRLKCVGASKTPVSDLVVAHNVHPTIAPAVSCNTTCTGTVAAPVPQTITLTLTLKSADGPSTAPTYTVTLIGQRRPT